MLDSRPIDRLVKDILTLPNYVNPDPNSVQNYRVDDRFLYKVDQMIGSADRISSASPACQLTATVSARAAREYAGVDAEQRV
jgi:hypothetical protein